MAVVVWFKRDLRIYDHAALNAAVARAAELGVPVVPLYVVEPGYWALPDASGRHWDTTAEGLEELRTDLGRLGAPLVVRVGDVVDILSAFHAKYGMSALFSHEEVGNAWTFARDRRVAAWARAQGVPWHEHRQAPVLRAMKGGEDWEEWRLSFLHAPSLRPPAALQGLADLDPRAIPTSAQLGITDHCPGRQPGGRRAGVACLTSFLTERGEGSRWAISKPDAAEHAGGRISPHLAYGTLSVRDGSVKVPTVSKRVRKDILDAGWAMTKSMLATKLARAGKRLVRVNPAFTSQGCSACGHVEKDNRKGKVFTCLACGHTMDADVNAGWNVRKRAIAAVVAGAKAAKNEQTGTAGSAGVAPGGSLKRSDEGRKRTAVVEGRQALEKPQRAAAG